MPTLHRSMRVGDLLRIGSATVEIAPRDPKRGGTAVRLIITAPADVLIEHSSGDRAPLLPPPTTVKVTR